MKKAVILSVLLFGTLVFATEKTCDPSKCSKACAEKMNAKKEVAQATTISETPAPAKVDSTKTTEQPKEAPVIPAKLDSVNIAEQPKEMPAVPAACANEKQCKELTQFHAAMHPMALAIGFEGDGKTDYAKVRSLYPNMKTKTEALAKMVCDNKCCKDPKAFNAKRDELIKAVDELGVACKGKDDAKINPVFEKVHQAYINLATMCK